MEFFKMKFKWQVFPHHLLPQKVNTMNEKVYFNREIPLGEMQSLYFCSLRPVV